MRPPIYTEPECFNSILHLRGFQSGVLAPNLLPMSLSLWPIWRYILTSYCSTQKITSGMCESNVKVKYLHCRDKVLVWVWPALSVIGLVNIIIFFAPIIILNNCSSFCPWCSVTSLRAGPRPWHGSGHSELGTREPHLAGSRLLHPRLKMRRRRCDNFWFIL